MFKFIHSRDFSTDIYMGSQAKHKHWEKTRHCCIRQVCLNIKATQRCNESTVHSVHFTLFSANFILLSKLVISAYLFHSCSSLLGTPDKRLPSTF